MNQLENKIVYNGTEYEFVIDVTPTEGSSAFITSGAVYSLSQSLADFVGKHIVNEVKDGNYNAVTSGAVFSALSNKANSSTVSTLSSNVSMLTSTVNGMSSTVNQLESAQLIDKVNELKANVITLNDNITALLAALSSATITGYIAPTPDDIDWGTSWSDD